MGLAYHAQRQGVEGVALVAVAFCVRVERGGRFVRDRDAARAEGEVQLPVRLYRPDHRRWEVAARLRPDPLAVQHYLVLVGLARLETRDPDEGVAVALDLEGTGAVSEDFNLAGGVRLHPDGRLRLSGVAEQRAED